MLDLRDPDDAVIQLAITDEVQKVVREWRKDLAVRMGNEVGQHVAKAISAIAKATS